MAKDKIVNPGKLLLIGGSAGSIEVILNALTGIRETLSFPIVIVLHRKSSSDSALSELFATRTKIPVKEASDKENIRAGHIYVAPADYHLLFEKDHTFSLDFSEKVNFSRPSIDVSFESAADAYGSGLTCLLLSGANADGVEGLRAVKENNGFLAVQNPELAESPFMPQNALLKNDIDLVLDPGAMAGFINQL